MHQRDLGLGRAGGGEGGFAGLVLACEPTGHRWKPLVVTARAAGIPVVCVQPLLVRRAREGEDFTRSRSDFGDAVIIARLTAELRCRDAQNFGVLVLEHEEGAISGSASRPWAGSEPSHT